MDTLSKRTMRQTRGGGTTPNSNAAIQAQISATWPGPKGLGGFFAPPPGSFALFADLNGLTVKELQELIRTP